MQCRYWEVLEQQMINTFSHFKQKYFFCLVRPHAHVCFIASIVVSCARRCDCMLKKLYMWPSCNLQPLMRKGLVYVACEIPREHCVSVFTNIRKIELKNWCHRIQVHAWVHQFPSRFTPVKGLSLTILALK